MWVLLWEPEAMAKLNVKSVMSAKPGRHGDGGGLYLIVKPTLARSWILRVVVDGRRRDIGLGSIAKLSLAEARERAAELRKHALNGRDPVTERDRKEFIPKTFKEAAQAVHEAKRVGWGSKTADAFLSSLADHAHPILGDLLVEHIDAADVARALKPIWTSKPAMAAKVRQRIGSVLSYSKASKWRTTEAPTQSLSQLLSRQGVSTPMAAMPYTEVPAFVKDLRSKTETMGRLALLFTIATVARGGEARNTRWSHIDLERRLWNRPADLMKSKVAHTVTLNDLALGILRRARALRIGQADTPVFPAKSGGALSDMTVSKIMRDAGLPYVPHGFRSSFRDWSAELMPNIPDAVAEAALAHAVPDKVVAAYKRTQFVEMRRQLLDAWGVYLSGDSNVLPLWATEGRKA
jgi:integrase